MPKSTFKDENTFTCPACKKPIPATVHVEFDIDYVLAGSSDGGGATEHHLTGAIPKRFRVTGIVLTHDCTPPSMAKTMRTINALNAAAGAR